jgi:hypothetical protein
LTGLLDVVRGDDDRNTGTRDFNQIVPNTEESKQMTNEKPAMITQLGNASVVSSHSNAREKLDRERESTEHEAPGRHQRLVRPESVNAGCGAMPRRVRLGVADRRRDCAPDDPGEKREEREV